MQQQPSSSFTSSFKDFMVKNGIVATAASITIGFATATFVKSFVADVVMPLIFLLIVGGASRISKDTGNFFSRFLASKEFRFTNFISEIVTWVLIIVSAYLVLEMVRRYLADSAAVAPAVQSNPFAPPPQPVIVAPPKQAVVPVVSSAPVLPGVKEEYGGYDKMASSYALY